MPCVFNRSAHGFFEPNDSESNNHNRDRACNNPMPLSHIPPSIEMAVLADTHGSTAAVAVVAFAVLGLAVAGVVPTVLGAGAHLGPGSSGAVAGGMLAAVYVSFLICPPLIGWLAELVSLQAALLTVGLSGLGIRSLSRAVDRR